MIVLKEYNTKTDTVSMSIKEFDMLVESNNQIILIKRLIRDGLKLFYDGQEIDLDCLKGVTK